MLNRKRVREKRKFKLSQYFQEFKKGDTVALIRNLSFAAPFPHTFQGKTGTIVEKQGNSYIVRLLNGKTYKKLTVNPIHLKKLKQ